MKTKLLFLTGLLAIGGLIAGFQSQFSGGGTPANGVVSTTAPSSALTGQILSANNGSNPSWASPSISLGNGGAPVTAGAYTAQCDSATSLVDRGKLIIYASGANTTQNIPQLQNNTATCGGMYFKILNDGATATTAGMTFNRQGTDVFRYCQPFTTCTDNATSFTLLNGEQANVYQANAGEWEVLVDDGVYGSISLFGLTSGSVALAVNATSTQLQIVNAFVDVPNNAGFCGTQSTSGAGSQGPCLSFAGTGTTEMLQTTGGSSTGLLKTAGPCILTAPLTMSGVQQNICSWTLPSIAKVWMWQCQGTYTLTAGTTPTLVLAFNPAQTATVIGTAQIYSTNTGTQTSGTATLSAGTGSTVMLTGATNTTASAPWKSYGAISASGTSGAFAITAAMGGTTPSGTINAGSTCILQ